LGSPILGVFMVGVSMGFTMHFRWQKNANRALRILLGLFVALGISQRVCGQEVPFGDRATGRGGSDAF
jgi:hypothetical protein